MMRQSPMRLPFAVVTLVVTLCWCTIAESVSSPTAAEVLHQVDGFRTASDQFTVTITITDYQQDTIKERAVFMGHFSGADTSLLVCTEGRNRNMKVLMKGDRMWVNLPSSKRALRITPMQRLLGQAANGDVAKVAFSTDYEGEIVAHDADAIHLRLHAIRRGATYGRVELVVDPVSFQPITAEFFVQSGKHLKTARYGDTMIVDGHQVMRSITIVDALNKNVRTTIEYADIADAELPDKLFNIMHLPRLNVGLP